MFRVWLPQPSIAVSPLADFTPSPNTREMTCLGNTPTLGACAMATKFLDNKICTFRILLSWRFPGKTVLFDNFPLCPQGPPPSKVQNFIFIVVSPSLGPCEKPNQPKSQSFGPRLDWEKHCKEIHFEGRRRNFGTSFFCDCVLSSGRGGSDCHYRVGSDCTTTSFGSAWSHNTTAARGYLRA